MKNMLFYFFLCFACVVSGQSIKGTSWRLLSFDNLKTSTVKSVEDKIEATLEFGLDSIYKGNMCNGYSGTFEVSNESSLNMKRPMATKRHCVGLSEIERDLFSFYGKATRYKIAEDKLFIFTSDEYRLVFKKQ